MRGEIAERLLAHERVDLKRQAGGRALPRRHQRALEAAGDAAEAIVVRGGGAVQAQRDGLHAGGHEPAHGRPR